MILFTLYSFVLSVCKNGSNVDTRFYILKTGLIRPDQDIIMSREKKDFYSADFGIEYQDGNESNLGSVRYPYKTNVIDIIVSKIIKPNATILDTNDMYIDWYVLKCENDGWHIDGQVMPREYFTVSFYDNDTLYASTHIEKNVVYRFDDDVLIWKNNTFIESKQLYFKYWYYGDYEPYDESRRVFIVNNDMNFYAVWDYESDTSSDMSSMESFTDMSSMESFTDMSSTETFTDISSTETFTDTELYLNDITNTSIEESSGDKDKIPIIASTVVAAIIIVSIVSIIIICKCGAAHVESYMDVHKMDDMISI